MIINADDFGISENVNNAVCEAFKRGVINRTTIMVNMPCCEQAAELAKENGFFDSVGLHINLTEGTPLTQKCRNSSLCDETGAFTGTFHISKRARLWLGKEDVEAIYCETEAQIKKYIEMGFTLMHADSHNYTHTYLSVSRPINRLLKKYRFKSVRISRNMPKGDFSPAFCIYKVIYNFFIRRVKCGGKRIKTTKYFGSFQDFEKFSRQKPEEKDVEIMTHPIFENGELIDNTNPAPHPFITKDELLKRGILLKNFSDRRKHIFVAFIHSHVGGAMTSLVSFLNALDTERYAVDLLFYENGEGERHGIKEEINILPEAREKGLLPRKFFSVRYIIAKMRGQYYRKIRKNKRRAVQIEAKQGVRYTRKVKEEYDVAIAYEFDWCLYYVTKYINAGKKIAWLHLDYDKAGFAFKEDRAYFEKMDKLVFVSEECMKKFAKRHKELAEKCCFFPNLLCADSVKAKGDAQTAVLPFERGKDAFVMLTVARIDFAHKGLDRGVEIVKRLKKETGKDIKWVIIGKGKHLEKLREMVLSEGLKDSIFTLGLIKNPMPYMKLCDILFLPSRFEGKPMVVTEAQIMGLVPVVAQYASANEQIQDGTNGFVAENDTESLYNMLKMLVENPQKIEAARQNIKNNDFGNEDEIKRFYEIIK